MFSAIHPKQVWGGCRKTQIIIPAQAEPNWLLLSRTKNWAPAVAGVTKRGAGVSKEADCRVAVTLVTVYLLQ